jgi:tetratricopeptide (TPR) repeat protein
MIRALFASALLAAAAAPDAPARGADALEQPRAMHARGVAGDRQAVVECIGALERILELDPGNARARAWLGSAWTLRARDLGIGPGKLEALKRGGRLMDEAVAASDDPEVRLVRAINSASLPALFGRRAVAREDYRILLERARDRARLLDARTAQAIFLHAGDFLAREGRRDEALAAWRDGLRVEPETALAREIGHRIAAEPGT